MDDFFRFPHTPHLAWLGAGVPRDDKVLTECEAQEFLAHDLVLEEKVDGANLGISVDENLRIRVQNRGQYLAPPYEGQFGRLQEWLEFRADDLALALADGLILFGEWCAARHSLDYDALPDWLLVFDVYDRNMQTFWSVERRDELVRNLGLVSVPRIGSGRFTFEGLKNDVLSRPSMLRSGSMEGVVARIQDDGVTMARAKLVRPEFVQAIGIHWSRRRIEWNRCLMPGNRRDAFHA